MEPPIYPPEDAKLFEKDPSKFQHLWDHIQISLVLFLESANFGQADDSTIHAINALKYYDNFLPRFVSTFGLIRLAIVDCFAEVFYKSWTSRANENDTYRFIWPSN